MDLDIEFKDTFGLPPWPADANDLFHYYARMEEQVDSKKRRHSRDESARAAKRRRRQQPLSAGVDASDRFPPEPTMRLSEGDSFIRCFQSKDSSQVVFMAVDVVRTLYDDPAKKKTISTLLKLLNMPDERLCIAKQMTTNRTQMVNVLTRKGVDSLVDRVRKESKHSAGVSRVLQMLQSQSATASL